MGRATWLADVLRAEGLHVIELDGWRTRETRTGFNPAGLVLHHTATPKSASDESVRRILRDGRSDLSGPLSQLGLERDGTYVVIAAGRCNHNGYGLWGNDSIGIEAYNDGKGEPWAPAQFTAYLMGSAAICRWMGWDPMQRVKGHRETDPNRKIDPAGLDLNDFRRRVNALLAPSPQQEAGMEIRKVSNGRYYLVGGAKPVRLDAPTLAAMQKDGWKVEPGTVPLAVWNEAY